MKRELVLCSTGAITTKSTPTNLHHIKTATHGKLNDEPAT
jgi:hypothetical protein